MINYEFELKNKNRIIKSNWIYLLFTYKYYLKKCWLIMEYKHKLKINMNNSFIINLLSKFRTSKGFKRIVSEYIYLFIVIYIYMKKREKGRQFSKQMKIDILTYYYEKS